MKAQARRCLPGVILLCVMLASSGCSCDTIVEENELPTSRIIVKQDGWNNCDNPESVNRTLSTTIGLTRKTTWWFEGRTGIGGKIPVGFLGQELDVDAALTAHYGKETTETWQETSTDAFPINAYENFFYVTYYQEVIRRGIIQACGKKIEYEFPAELTIVGHKSGVAPCPKGPNLIFYCAILPNQPVPTLTPGYEGIDRTWQLVSPANGEILQMDVQIEWATLLFHVYSDCKSGPCEWGYQTTCVWQDPIMVVFDNLGYKETTLTIQPLRYGELHMQVRDHFINPPTNVSDQVTEYIMR